MTPFSVNVSTLSCLIDKRCAIYIIIKQLGTAGSLPVQYFKCCLDLLYIFSTRLLESVDAFERLLINSSLLSNSTSTAVILHAPLFAVAATVACPTTNASFPGKSFRSSKDLSISADGTANLNLLIEEADTIAAVNLPKNFAELTGGTIPTKKNNVNNCPKPVAIVFHVFRNGKMFQSASAESSNLQLPVTGLLLGDDLRVINSYVVSASLTDGLNTSHLQRSMTFVLAEEAPLVSIGTSFSLRAPISLPFLSSAITGL